MEEEKGERQFKRYMLQSDVEIFDATNGGLIETTQLKDLSGGGACFRSTKPGAYLPGQEITLVIRLPATDKLSAHMQGRALVIWVGSQSAHDEKGRSVGVDLIDPLRFHEDQRNKGADGSHPEETA